MGFAPCRALSPIYYKLPGPAREVFKGELKNGAETTSANSYTGDCTARLLKGIKNGADIKNPRR